MVLSPEQERVRAKQEWIKQFRLKFCIRPDFEITRNIIHPDGSLNQDYFRPPRGSKRAPTRKWTDTEKDLLIEGIEKYGIGNFGEISKELLPKWTTNELRIKCIRLIGRQNLQLYRGWKGNADDIAREYAYNKALGIKHGTLKQGVLVYDDDGKVEKELREYHKNKEQDKGKQKVDSSKEPKKSMDEDVEMN
ncbi:hypothetical protein K492DRAFT_129326 [Lichtheimia hyalospora FSU 10163]|nr:hypothetical protein K492DRAFT_129326 [Lichtheimia hyalospora FSU 10163]